MGGKKLPKSLSYGRPPLCQHKAKQLSARATRTVIRRHHNLLKSQAKALKSGDDHTAAAIAKQIEDNGGLKKYQQASQIGQSGSRGGDSSKVLCDWLNELIDPYKNDDNGLPDVAELKILEIGCLSPDNAISTHPGVHLVRIDLHSTHPSIEEQDFMKRPKPGSDADKFSVISLSLVLNYIPDAIARGAMLLRTTEYLESNHVTCSGVLPALFLTLPLSCVSNSRYLTVNHLEVIMISLGYRMLKSKFTAKIFYSLWHFDALKEAQRKPFCKREIAPGKGRNNFCIYIDI